MGRHSAQEFIPGPNCGIISITTPGDKPAKLNGSWVSVLRWSRGDDETPVSPEDVKRIWDWVEANKHLNLYVHCDAGISRSAGVAQAIAMYLDCKVQPLEMKDIRYFLSFADDENLTVESLANKTIKAALMRHLWEKRLIVEAKESDDAGV